MPDNNFDIMSTIEYMPSAACAEVRFRSSMGCPIYVRFTKNDVVVLGDYGCWVFKGNIVNCYQFFRGNHTNPGYWAEKLEAAPQSHYNRTVDAAALCKALLENYPDTIKEDDLEYLVSDRDSLESWYDTVYDLNCRKGWDLEMEDLYGTMQSCIVEDMLYLKVCELVQCAANYLTDKHITEEVADGTE